MLPYRTEQSFAMDIVGDDQTLNLHLPPYSPVSFQTTPADPIIKRVETVGKILPNVTAKIVNRDGNIVPRGTPGEVLVKGYLVQKGYGCPHSNLFVCIHWRRELTFIG